MAKPKLKVIAQNDVLQDVMRYRQLKRLIKPLEDEADEIASRLKSGYFKDHESFVHDGELLLTCKSYEEKRFDKKSFEVEYPNLIKKYTVLLVKKVLQVK